VAALKVGGWRNRHRAGAAGGFGMYGVIAFSAALRVQEMAIRMALGSQRFGILGLVFASAAKLAIAGCALGLLGAFAASRLLGSFLFGVSPFVPLVLTLAAVLDHRRPLHARRSVVSCACGGGQVADLTHSFIFQKQREQD
jgi:hypothetical protein